MAAHSKLDEQELLHLALEAMRGEQHGPAIEYLKEALERSPASFQAAYLLAAQYAQIGLTERAVEGFARALEIQPAFQPARFQLGLLQLCNGLVPEAMGTLEPLERLPEADPYRHFGAGLLQLCRDEFAASEASFRHGMELNTVNPALNGDIRKILERMAGRDPGEPQTGHALLSAYTKSLN